MDNNCKVTEEGLKMLAQAIPTMKEQIELMDSYNKKLTKIVLIAIISCSIISVSGFVCFVVRDHIQYSSSYDYPDKTITQTQTTITGNDNTLEKGGK